MSENDTDSHIINLARLAGLYYRELLGRGVPDALAADLVRDWQHRRIADAAAIYDAATQRWVATTERYRVPPLPPAADVGNPDTPSESST